MPRGLRLGNWGSRSGGVLNPLLRSRSSFQYLSHRGKSQWWPRSCCIHRCICSGLQHDPSSPPHTPTALAHNAVTTSIHTGWPSPSPRGAPAVSGYFQYPAHTFGLTIWQQTKSLVSYGIPRLSVSWLSPEEVLSHQLNSALTHRRMTCALIHSMRQLLFLIRYHNMDSTLIGRSSQHMYPKPGELAGHCFSLLQVLCPANLQHRRPPTAAHSEELHSHPPCSSLTQPVLVPYRTCIGVSRRPAPRIGARRVPNAATFAT